MIAEITARRRGRPLGVGDPGREREDALTLLLLEMTPELPPRGAIIFAKIICDNRTRWQAGRENGTLKLRISPSPRINLNQFKTQLGYALQRLSGSHGPPLQIEKTSASVKAHIRLLIGLLAARTSREMKTVAKQLVRFGWDNSAVDILKALALLKYSQVGSEVLIE